MDYKINEEKLKGFYKKLRNPEIANTDLVEEFENIFPELVESREEKIKKALIRLIDDGRNGRAFVEIYGVPVTEIIAWINERGKDKPESENIEAPLLEKFKEAVYKCAWGKVTQNAEGETQEEYADRWAEQLLSMVRDWADDYLDYNIDARLRKAYQKGYKKGEQDAAINQANKVDEY